jgi:hypothetical protein
MWSRSLALALLLLSAPALAGVKEKVAAGGRDGALGRSRPLMQCETSITLAGRFAFSVAGS